MIMHEITSGLAFPEGPVVMPDGSVIVCEMFNGNITRVWGEGKKEVIVNVGGAPTGAQVGPDGALYICNLGGFDAARFLSTNGAGDEGRIERVDLVTGNCDRLYDRCGDRMLQGADDIVFDSTGNFWFTDFGKDLDNSRVYGGLYYASVDGSSIKQVYAPGTAFNGVVLSPDERTVYVSDTYSARVWSMDIEQPGGSNENGTNHARKLHATILTGGMVDSMAALASGSVCVGMILPGGIAVVKPSGEVEWHLTPGDDIVTNIAFGGYDMCDAYITFSGTGRLMKTRWPEPGLKLNFFE